jgi:hypothetical protein
MSRIRKEVLMEAISIKRLGMACGFTSALLYVECVFVMWTVGREGSILFFNSLMHGIDVTTIIRTEMPWWEMMGLVQMFIIGWLSGATRACTYNFAFGNGKGNGK